MVFSNTYYFVLFVLQPHGFFYTYFLFDVLGFIIVLYQNRVFEYILVYSGCGGGGGGGEGGRGGLWYITAKRIFVRRENCFGGLKTKLRGTFGNFNVPPRVFCQVWLNAYLSMKIDMQ